MINILITGASGQLGSELNDIACNFDNYNFFFTEVDTLDITDHSYVKKYVINNNIDVIINCAAYTAVDKAEIHVEMNNKINNLAVRNLAEISKERDIKLIHISTDYVFDGNANSPYLETDKTNPQSNYGKMKLAGEIAIKEINPKNSIIIRTSWLYSSFGNNFVKTMIRMSKEKKQLEIISDQFGTPTFAGDLASTILEIIPKINNDFVEIFHYSNEGISNWYNFANKIFEICNKSIKVLPIKTANYFSKVKRPNYSVLNKTKIKNKFNLKIPKWEDSLVKCLFKLNNE